MRAVKNLVRIEVQIDVPEILARVRFMNDLNLAITQRRHHHDLIIKLLAMTQRRLRLPVLGVTPTLATADHEQSVKIKQRIRQQRFFLQRLKLRGVDVRQLLKPSQVIITLRVLLTVGLHQVFDSKLQALSIALPLGLVPPLHQRTIQNPTIRNFCRFIRGQNMTERARQEAHQQNCKHSISFHLLCTL